MASPGWKIFSSEDRARTVFADDPESLQLYVVVAHVGSFGRRFRTSGSDAGMTGWKPTSQPKPPLSKWIAAECEGGDT